MRKVEGVSIATVLALLVALGMQEWRHRGRIAALEARLSEVPALAVQPVHPPGRSREGAPPPPKARPARPPSPTAPVSPQVLDDLLENRRRENVGREFDKMVEWLRPEQRNDVRQHLDRMVEEGLEPEAAAAIERILFDEIDVDLRNRRAVLLGDLEQDAYFADKMALQAECNRRIAAYVSWDDVGVLRSDYVPDAASAESPSEEGQPR